MMNKWIDSLAVQHYSYSSVCSANHIFYQEDSKLPHYLGRYPEGEDSPYLFHTYMN